MEYKCKICGRPNNLTTLHFDACEEYDEFDLYVCHTCWDIISNIANRALASTIKELEERLKKVEAFTGEHESRLNNIQPNYY